MGIYGFKILNYDVTKSMKRISDIMSSKIEFIQTSESVKEPAKKMLDKNVSSLVVINEGEQSIRIITERDIKRGVRIHDVLTKEFKIHHLMTPLPTIDPNSSVEKAANLMLP